MLSILPLWLLLWLAWANGTSANVTRVKGMISTCELGLPLLEGCRLHRREPCFASWGMKDHMERERGLIISRSPAPTDQGAGWNRVSTGDVSRRTAQPVIIWEISHFSCSKPPSFGVVCYLAIDKQYTPLLIILNSVIRVILFII